MKLILGTMTFGESVFSPEVGMFIDCFLGSGNTEIDTAYVYNEGRCETLLGEVLPQERRPYTIATKVNPNVTGRLDGEAAYMQVKESLRRMNRDSVDIVYLHFPDSQTPVESVLEAMDNLHREGRFTELGLSNFPAWMVADVWHRCAAHGWVEPTVYEGIYNPLTRKAETELDACISAYGLRFYAYNPLAGGLLTGRYGKFEDAPEDGRFTHRANYRSRFWKRSYFDAIALLKEACAKEGVPVAEATYRWLAYHSMLKEERGDGIIIGASKLSHLVDNMESQKGGPLPNALLEAFEAAWSICKADSPDYFRLFR
ncbi:MAG: aldo/keto reductase [Spirochaetales bacterium]|nr:aldo/keto reductase [Spirochaetales bacterium]